MGDLQCSVKSTLEDSDKDAVVNVSTSAQMAFVQPDGFQPTVVSGEAARTSTEYFPYFEVRKPIDVRSEVRGREQFLC